MSDYGGGGDDGMDDYGAGEEYGENLINEEDLLENYDNADGDVDMDDPASLNQPNGQTQLDSTDYTNNAVESGDVDAQRAARELNTVKGVRNRRIPNEKRTTTPYMTKYERARVLGTRALQIRYALRITTCPRHREGIQKASRLTGLTA